MRHKYKIDVLLTTCGGLRIWRKDANTETPRRGVGNTDLETEDKKAIASPSPFWARERVGLVEPSYLQDRQAALHCGP